MKRILLEIGVVLLQTIITIAIVILMYYLVQRYKGNSSPNIKNHEKEKE